MEIQRVCHYVTGFLHAPIRVFDLEGNQAEVYWDSGAQQNPAQLEPELCTALLTLAQPLQPALHVEGKGILYGVVKAHREAYLVGPCRLRDLPPASGEEGGREADFRYVPEISLEQFTNGVLMLYESATGQTMDPGSLWRDSFRSGDLLQHVDRRSHTILFANREEERPHNPYRQERREQNAIQTGDLAALEESFREEYGGRVGTLARTPLRHARNLAIVLITLASRSAIAGGLLPEVAYSLSDAFIQQAEELESEGEVIALARQAEVEYCRRVAALAGGGSRNPLVVRCKELVFQKLHTKIEIQTLAEQLGVRAGSLSQLFNREEGITLRDYISREKVNASKHRLIYTTDSFDDIAATFAFASQSHYGRVFKKWTGMTPGQYRARYCRAAGEEDR